MGNSNIYLCRFFVVEDHILNTTNGLVTRAYLDEVWEMALSKITGSLRTHSVSHRLISCWHGSPCIS